MLNKLLEKHPIINLVLIMIYKLLLDYIYKTWISKIFAYQGLVLTDGNQSFYIISLFSSAFFAYICSYHLLRRNTISDMVLSFLILMYYIPGTTLFAFMHNNVGYFVFVTLFFILLLFLNRLIPVPDISVGTNSETDYLKYVVVGLCLVNIGISAVYSNFRISFDFSEFYESRFEAREYGIPSPLMYLFNWSRFILPLSAIYYLLIKRFSLAALISFAQILCFSFNGKKSGVFLFFGAFLIYLVYNKSLLSKIPLYLGLMIGVSTIAIYMSGWSLIGQYVIRRVIFVPSMLGYDYYDFFSTHELDYLRSSFLRHLGFVSPYESISRVIGYAYAGENEMGEANLNTGLCGDAFANFGWFSLLLYPLLIVITLKITNACFKGLGPVLAFFVSIEVMYMMMNGAFFKLLLTNGLIVICLVMRRVKRNNLSTQEPIIMSNE